MNPFKYGQSFIGKSFPKRIGTLNPPNPKILKGGTMCPAPRYSHILKKAGLNRVKTSNTCFVFIVHNSNYFLGRK